MQTGNVESGEGRFTAEDAKEWRLSFCPKDATVRRMSRASRATIYLEPEVLCAVRLRAEDTDRSISEVINTAVKERLAEDAEDLKHYQRRRREKSIDFEEFVKAMKQRGKL